MAVSPIFQNPIFHFSASWDFLPRGWLEDVERHFIDIYG